MVKENSIVPMGARDDRPDYDYAEGVELRIYELQEGAEAVKTVYGMTNQAELTVKAAKAAGTITIEVEASKAYTIRLMNVMAASVEGAEMVIEGNDTVLKPNAGKMVVSL